MTNILIIGATGAIAREAISLFDDRTECTLTLYQRRAGPENGHRTIIGDATDETALTRAMAGQDVVYANLSGNLPQQARAITSAMDATGVKRLIFILSMGIHDEVPGETYGSILDPYRHTAEVIAHSDLDYTILRPAWLNDKAEISYGTTTRNEPFKYPDAYVSRRSVADMVVKLATNPGLASRESLGIHKK